ncbi:MAG: hypothetical protein R6U98_20195, partial [Pirellulaceae bacterium]
EQNPRSRFNGRKKLRDYLGLFNAIQELSVLFEGVVNQSKTVSSFEHRKASFHDLTPSRSYPFLVIRFVYTPGSFVIDGFFWWFSSWLW